MFGMYGRYAMYGMNGCCCMDGKYGVSLLGMVCLI